MTSPSAVPPPPSTTRRAVLRLAIPAFLALVAEPLFLLADSAIVGHLGTVSLAGLGVASTALLTTSGVLVFLAYGTTAAAARQLGAGSPARAVEVGMDGLYLALALGAATGLGLALLAGPVVDLFGAGATVADQAVTYLRISVLGLPAMLVVLAVTGVLRGLQDTRTPLVASVVGFSANIVLNYLLVFPAGLGIAGSAWGTVIAQNGMAAGLVAALLVLARRHRARLAPHPAGVLRSARDGVWLLVRTLALRGALLLTVWAAAGLGTVALAAHQVVFTVWSFLVFALDALAIAAQALTGQSLGAGDLAATRATTRLMTRWGVLTGLAVGAIVAALHSVLPLAFSADPPVRAAISAALLVVAAGQILSGYVFVLDGVLIGAGDGRWLAGAMVLALVTYLPVLLWVRSVTPGPAGGASGTAPALVALWLAFHVFLAARALTLWWRGRGEHWLVTGA